MSTTQSTLGDAIQKLRKLKNVKQNEMALQIGISPNHLYRVESNMSKPSPELLQNIAEYLGVPVSTILFEALSAKDFKSKKDQELFAKAQPLIDKMLKSLMPKD